MPNWKFHNDWAVKLGIPRDIANWVNKREDMPKIDHFDDKGLQKFKENLPEDLPTYNEMAKKGGEYLRAWILHILIDEIEDICEYLSENALEKYETGTDLYEEAKDMFFSNSLLRLVPDDIQKFISANINELIKDMPVPYFQMNREMMLRDK